jgi:hypothetical protein
MNIYVFTHTHKCTNMSVLTYTHKATTVNFLNVYTYTYITIHVYRCKNRYLILTELTFD